jgi:hypothetical protein
MNKCLLVGLFGRNFLRLSLTFREAIHGIARLPFLDCWLRNGNNVINCSVIKVGNSNIADCQINLKCNRILISYQFILVEYTTVLYRLPEPA